MSLAVLIFPIILYPYFIIVTPIRYYLYSLTMLLYMLVSVGALLKIMHLPGADEVLTVGMMSDVLAGIFLIISGIKSVDHKFKIYKIVLGILLIGGLALGILYSVLDSYHLHMIIVLLPCVVLLIAAWIIIVKEPFIKGKGIYLLLF